MLRLEHESVNSRPSRRRDGLTIQPTDKQTHRRSHGDFQLSIRWFSARVNNLNPANLVDRKARLRPAAAAVTSRRAPAAASVAVAGQRVSRTTPATTRAWTCPSLCPTYSAAQVSWWKFISGSNPRYDLWPNYLSYTIYYPMTPHVRPIPCSILILDICVNAYIGLSVTGWSLNIVFFP